MMMIMLSYMLGMPGMMTAPGLYDLLADYKDKDEVITENNNKPKPAKAKTDTLYEHACKGHPHDPLCPACVRARMTSKANTKNDEDMIIKGSDDGAVMGIDYIGPYMWLHKVEIKVLVKTSLWRKIQSKFLLMPIAWKPFSVGVSHLKKKKKFEQNLFS